MMPTTSPSSQRISAALPNRSRSAASRYCPASPADRRTRKSPSSRSTTSASSCHHSRRPKGRSSCVPASGARMAVRRSVSSVSVSTPSRSSARQASACDQP
ncbi:hypothetical protein BE20_12690 [Sorangium cellulosum]|nr:hypothetical protein BE20_12690 [Sorangium cellulosum]